MADEAYFHSIPWCSNILSTLKGCTITNIDSRNAKPNGEDSLFAETLRTPETINAALAFFRTPSVDEMLKFAQSIQRRDRGPIIPPINEIGLFLSFGDGLNGYPFVLHGGLIAAIFDEIPGAMLILNYIQLGRNLVPREVNNSVTASLSIKYLQRVATPGVVLVRSRFDRVQGRRMFAQSWIEDEHGAKLAEAELMFVTLKPKL